MDPELKTLIKALMDGQIKLAEGHVETQASIRHLAETTEVSIASLAEKVSFLSERLDSFGEKVVCGFTDSAQREGDLDRRVSKLESEVESLKSP